METKFLKWLLNLFELKSPCCKTNTKSYFDMEHDFMLYECNKCKKIFY